MIGYKACMPTSSSADGIKKKVKNIVVQAYNVYRPVSTTARRGRAVLRLDASDKLPLLKGGWSHASISYATHDIYQYQ